MCYCYISCDDSLVKIQDIIKDTTHLDNWKPELLTTASLLFPILSIRKLSGAVTVHMLQKRLCSCSAKKLSCLWLKCSDWTVNMHKRRNTLHYRKCTLIIRSCTNMEFMPQTLWTRLAAGLNGKAFIHFGGTIYTSQEPHLQSWTISAYFTQAFKKHCL